MTVGELRVCLDCHLDDDAAVLFYIRDDPQRIGIYIIESFEWDEKLTGALACVLTDSPEGIHQR